MFEWSDGPNGSKAPGGRLNLVYSTARHGDAVGELPLRYLVVGNFTGSKELPAISAREPVQVSLGKLDETMKALAPTATLEKVRDRLRPPTPDEQKKGLQPETPPIVLEFGSLADFHPDRILAQLTGGEIEAGPADKGKARRFPVQLPELARKLAIREELVRLRGPMGNRAEFRKAMETLIRDEKKRAQLMQALGMQDGA